MTQKRHEDQKTLEIARVSVLEKFETWFGQWNRKVRSENRKSFTALPHVTCQQLILLLYGETNITHKPEKTTSSLTHGGGRIMLWKYLFSAVIGKLNWMGRRMEINTGRLSPRKDD